MWPTPPTRAAWALLGLGVAFVFWATSIPDLSNVWSAIVIPFLALLLVIRFAPRLERRDVEGRSPGVSTQTSASPGVSRRIFGFAGSHLLFS